MTDPPVQLEPVRVPLPLRRRRIRMLVFQCAITVTALVLIAMTALFTTVSVNTEKQEALSRAEANLANLALAVQWQLTRQLQAVDQTLLLLAGDWQADPAHFDPNGWRKRSVLLGDTALRVFVLDARGVVTASTRPDLLGARLADRDYFQVQRIAQGKGRGQDLFVGPAIRWKATGRWEINLSRRLERGDGSFAGVIVAAYDPWTLTGLLEQVDLGARGLIALVGDDGAIRALVSPGEVSPGADISQSTMFQAMIERPQGHWIGPSAPDGVQRVHAFRRLGDQDLAIAVGMARDEVLRAADTWAANARMFAGTLSLVLLLMAGLLVREVEAASMRERRLAHDRLVLEHAYGALESAKASAEAKTAQIEATLSGMSDGVMMLDANLRLVQWNDCFAACTGVPQALLRVGTPMAELLRSQAAAGEFGAVDVAAEVRRRMAVLHAESGTVLMERLRPDGSTLEWRRSKLPGGGFVTLYTDITARKRTEEAQHAARRLAEEAIEQKSRFVTIVSHEIRTPLNAVVNSLALLDQSGLSTAQRKLAETASQAGDALLELVNDILELSKMEAEQLVVRPTTFAVRRLLEAVAEMFRAEAAARGISLSIEIAPDVPEWLRADAGRLRQVLMNFVSNAAKFSLPGRVTLCASAAERTGGPALVLAVRDQGPRIPDHQAVHLFQPFSRLDNARDTGTPGTGLGLAICERLTRLMGGQIGVCPTQEGGNEFWMAVPLQAALLAEIPAADVIIGPRFRRAGVLLVEDIAANHLVTATLLRRGGHRVDIAESGPDAIRLAAERPYDLVFMDLLMPGMSGDETARRFRALPGPASRVPIVALTANTAAEDRAHCLAAGMNDMLGKPVRAAEMFAMLARTDWPMPVPEPAAAPVLDGARLAEVRRGLAAATVAWLFEQCLDDMRRRLAILRDGLARGAAGDIEAASHAIAGMAGTYGFTAMEHRMRRIMQAAHRQDVVAARAASSGMEADLSAADEAVRDHLEIV